MAAKVQKKIFFPKTRLAELAARAGGMAREDALAGAMKSIEAMRGESDGAIRDAIAAMEKIVYACSTVGALDDAQMLAVLRHADQIVTLAGTFCYPALDSAARSLCDIADGLRRGGRYDVKPIAVHVQTMHLMAPGAMALSPEHAEMMLGELAKIAAHFNFGSLGAIATGDGEETVQAAAN
jgi:hypothetical protein